MQVCCLVMELINHTLLETSLHVCEVPKFETMSRRRFACSPDAAEVFLVHGS
jgi:hypothetical protein